MDEGTLSPFVTDGRCRSQPPIERSRAEPERS
jgi:hypothetical protein